MAKEKNPLFSFSAAGTVGDTLTYQKRGSGTMVRRKPIPINPKSLPQMYHRWLYQDYAALWHSLSQASKDQYNALARPYKITGFNYWMRSELLSLPDIIGGWHLDDLVPNLAIDFSSYANDGVIHGAIPTKGVIDTALLFDGVDDYVTMGNPAIFHLPDVLSLEAFINIHDPLTNYIVVGNIAVWTSGYALWGTPPNRITFTIVTTDGVRDVSTVVLNTNQWYHFVGTYDKDAGANNIKLYTDGDLTAQFTWTGAIIQPTRDFVLGRYSTWGTHACSIDEVRLYNRILTPEDIKRHALRRYPL